MMKTMMTITKMMTMMVMMMVTMTFKVAMIVDDNYVDDDDKW